MCYCTHCIFSLLLLFTAIVNTCSLYCCLLPWWAPSRVKTPVPYRYKHKAKNVYEKVVPASMHQLQSSWQLHALQLATSDSVSRLCKKISCQHPGWCEPFRFCTCYASEAGASQHQPQSSRQLACPAVMWHTWQLEEKFKLLSTASTPRTQQAFDGIARGVHEQESPPTASPVR